MNETLVALGVVVALVAIFLGFPLLDRWHRRRAWRQAHEETMREMRKRGPQ